jgi:hypothetical protein
LVAEQAGPDELGCPRFVSQLSRILQGDETAWVVNYGAERGTVT